MKLSAETTRASMELFPKRRHRYNVYYGVQKARLEMLHDGVYAIAMTLLLLNIAPPKEWTPEKWLSTVGPPLGVYVIAFASLAMCWTAHYYFASMFVRGDFAHVVFNLLPLLFVGTVPFSASSFAHGPSSREATMLFSLNLSILVGLYWLDWNHIRRHLLPRGSDAPFLRIIDAAILSVSFTTLVAALCAAHGWTYVAVGLVVVTILGGFATVALLEPYIVDAYHAAVAEANEEAAYFGGSVVSS